jgi:hypothetical protein
MTKEALRLALEALENIDRAMPFPVGKQAITAIKAALEAKDEPWTPDDMAYRPNALAQRTWVGLTPEEIDEIIETASDSTDALLQTMDKLKQKNGNA